MDNGSVGKVIAHLRIDAGLTQEEVASQLGRPQSFVSKIESGERSVTLLDVLTLARVLHIPATRIMNEVAGIDSVLDDIGLSEQELTLLIAANPSLRGMILGYAAEMKFQSMYVDPLNLHCVKDDDHDRAKKGDRRISYKGVDLIVEVKSLQTNTIKDQSDGTKEAKTQVDGSDKRVIVFDDGSSINTTCLKFGEFDILAVNCFSFDNTWKFQFALNCELEHSNYRKYSDTQKRLLIKSLQSVSSPARPPFTEDFEEILERAYRLKHME